MAKEPLATQEGSALGDQRVSEFAEAMGMIDGRGDGGFSAAKRSICIDCVAYHSTSSVISLGHVGV